MKLISVNEENVHVLQLFLLTMGNSAGTFRYFDKRDVSVIKNHLTTLLFMKDDAPVAYGHLDNEDGIVWLGLCVLPEYNGRGLGYRMARELIKAAKEMAIEKISITIDVHNLAAERLHEVFGFRETSRTLKTITCQGEVKNLFS